MYSEEVVQREKTGRLVVQAGRQHAHAIGTKLHARFKRVLPATFTPAEFVAIVLGTVALLEQSNEAMIAADLAHNLELKDDEPARRARDAARKSLYDTLVALRGGLLGIYGLSTCRDYGLEGVTPQDVNRLCHFSEGFLELARKHPVLPTPLLDGSSLDLALWTARVDAQARELSRTLEHVAREFREGEATQEKKWAAITAFDALLKQVEDWLEATFALAEEPGLAGRVTPTVPERQAEETTVAPEATEAPAGVDAATGG